MKECLLTLTNFVSEGQGTAVFNKLWSDFLDRHPDLPFDSEFVIKAKNHASLYEQTCGRYPCYLVETETVQDPKVLSWTGFRHAVEGGYKYWLLFDADCLPTSSALTTICNSLPDIDFFCMANHGRLHTQPPTNINDIHPWKIYMPGAGGIGGNVSFINHACSQLGRNAFFECKRDLATTCQLLGKPLQTTNCNISTDGFINTDLWTELHVQNARMGLVSDKKGASCRLKSGYYISSLLRGLVDNMTPVSCLSDSINLNPTEGFVPINAPYFHVGSSPGMDNMVNPNWWVLDHDPTTSLYLILFYYLLALESRMFQEPCCSAVLENVARSKMKTDDLIERSEEMLFVLKDTLGDRIQEETYSVFYNNLRDLRSAKVLPISYQNGPRFYGSQPVAVPEQPASTPTFSPRPVAIPRPAHQPSFRKPVKYNPPPKPAPSKRTGLCGFFEDFVNKVKWGKLAFVLSSNKRLRSHIDQCPVCQELLVREQPQML